MSCSFGIISWQREVCALLLACYVFVVSRVCRVTQYMFTVLCVCPVICCPCYVFDVSRVCRFTCMPCHVFAFH